MPNRFNAPSLRSDFIVIVNYERSDMAAVAISYLYNEGFYLPIFSFQNVEIGLGVDIQEPDVFAIQRRRAEHFSVFLNNAIIENRGCENLVFLGLSEEQKSYLDFAQHYNVLEIEAIEEIPAYLGGFGYDKGPVLTCSLGQLGPGLIQAVARQRILAIGIENTEIEEIVPDGDVGIVLIEHMENSDFIIGINYALSVNARCVTLPEIEEGQQKEVLYLLEGWQAGQMDAAARLKEMINMRIGHIDLAQYSYATFFTFGLPYSICAQDTPSSLVNLKYRPDFFIFNNIISESVEAVGSAVVFSPSEFESEETNVLLGLLEFKNFYLRKLIGESATCFNLKVTVEGYPFDVLHICSHGGDLGGTRCLVKFRDKGQVQHTVEFDHVLSIAITPYIDLHTVESYYHFRKLNGLVWRSEELRARGYSHELYASILNEISIAFKKKKVINLGPVQRVPNTKAISCHGPWHYQANFDQVGLSTVHPVIFNNSCWSWMTVSTSFLVGGARAYIGTLREIGNQEAVSFAEIFYQAVFDDNIIDAFHVANIDFLNGNDDPIYVFWGLHFSSLRNIRPVQTNKTNVLKKLGASLGTWARKLENDEGSLELLRGRVGDTRWMIADVVGTEEGHFPRRN